MERNYCRKKMAELRKDRREGEKRKVKYIYRQINCILYIVKTRRKMSW